MRINIPYKKVESSGFININSNTLTCTPNKTIKENIMLNKDLQNVYKWV